MRPIYVRSTAEAGIKEADILKVKAGINEAEAVRSTAEAGNRDSDIQAEAE